MSIYRLKLCGLEHVTRAIGYVCIVWVWLEDGINESLEILTPLENGQISHAITTNSDVRDKIKMIRAIAFVRKLDDDWFERLDAVLNRIDNDLRNRRNRFVHDAWHTQKGRLQRRTRQTKFRRAQAFAQIQLSTEEFAAVKVPDVWQLVTDIVRAMYELAGLMVEYHDFRKAIWNQIAKEHGEKVADQMLIELPSLLAKSSPQTPRPGARDSRPTNRRSKRQRPPRSSRASPR